MRVRACLTAGLTASLMVIGASFAGAAAARPRDPTPAQVAHAVAQAERSPQLWATVNICAARGARGGDLGVRGEMPTLGFPAQLRMTVQVNRYSAASGGFVALPGATARAALTVGQFSSGLQQDGAVFPFTSRAGLLDATVTFTWSRAGRTLGSVTRATTAGHPTAAFGRPAHYSAASCKLG